MNILDLQRSKLSEQRDELLYHARMFKARIKQLDEKRREKNVLNTAEEHTLKMLHIYLDECLEKIKATDDILGKMDFFFI